jgi:hypothetical protein
LDVISNSVIIILIILMMEYESVENDGITGTPTDSHQLPLQLDRRALLERAKSILSESAFVLTGTVKELQRAREVASVAGLKVDSYIIEKPKIVAALEGDAGSSSSAVAATTTTVVQNTTGGFSNTDHIIRKTKDAAADRIVELKRNLLRRHRSMQPENRRDERWDKPKVKGERRRKLVDRDKDQDDSPPEPPHTGWSIFVSQMTTKLRHDEPNVHHDQARGKTGGELHVALYVAGCVTPKKKHLIFSTTNISFHLQWCSFSQDWEFMEVCIIGRGTSILQQICRTGQERVSKSTH